MANAPSTHPPHPSRQQVGEWFANQRTMSPAYSPIHTVSGWVRRLGAWALLIAHCPLPIVSTHAHPSNRNNQPHDQQKKWPGAPRERRPKKKKNAGRKPAKDTTPDHDTRRPNPAERQACGLLLRRVGWLAGGWFVGLPRTGYPLSSGLCPPGAPSAQEPRCATILHRAPPRFAAHYHGPPCPTVRHRAPRCSTVLHRTPPCPYVVFLRHET